MDNQVGRILSVDDNLDNLDLLQRRLERRGHEVVSVTDGYKALEELEAAGQNPFDIVLLDIMMPEISGLETLEKIRERYSVEILPVIMVTAKSDSDTIIGALDKGANDYVTKPIDFSVLFARIQAQLKRKRAEVELRGMHDQLERLVDERTIELRNSEKRFQNFAEAASDWFWEAGPDLKINEVSPRFFELTQTQPSVIIGKTVQEFILSLPLPHSHNSVPVVFELTNTKPFRELAGTVISQDGIVSHFTISGMPFFDDEDNFLGYRGTGSDITQIIEAERRATSSQALLAEAIESMSDGFAFFDKDDRLELFNEKFRKVNANVDDILDKKPTFEEFFRARTERGGFPDALGREEEWIRNRIESHRNPGRPMEFRHKKGKWTEVTECRMSDGGTLSILTDISERKHAESMNLQSQKMHALGQLTGGVAHDFNNLLTVIMGNLQLMERTVQDDEKLLSRIDTIMGAARNGAEMTRRLLGFSRQQVLELEAIDINDLVDNTEELLKRTIQENINIVTNRSSDLCIARTDTNQLENALLNLCINARDAMPDGGDLYISTKLTYLDDYYTAMHDEVTPGEYVEIAITDTGTGIPPEIQKKIFDPFFTTKDSSKGTGLGLSTIYGFMKQAGGHISVYSEVGLGTTFHLYIPVTDVDETKDETPSVMDGARTTFSGTILIAEDNSAVREIAVSILEDAGFRVLEAEDGPGGLKAANEHPEIDLVFSDVIMPGGMTGPEMIDQIRKLSPGIPVLFASGYAEDALMKLDSLENADFVSKPYDVEKLPSRIAELLGKLS